MSFSTKDEVEEAYNVVRQTFASGKTKDKSWRKRQLQKLFWMLYDNKERVCEAVKADLNKHTQEVLTSDYGMTQNAVLETIANLENWTADERPRRTNLFNYLGRATIRKEPVGAVLIIGAWNFPINLLLEPLAAAIAAGCTAIIKPSDVALKSQALLQEIVPKYLDQDAVRCITAGPQEMSNILSYRFDHIFYTGSPPVAKIIYAAAAKFLTPVTLELGGQGPAIVTKNADVDLSAKRIAATKFTNAGQVCINVNHVLVDPSVRDKFVQNLAKYFDEFLGGGKESPEWYSKIVSQRHFDRLSDLLEKTSGKVVYGGQRDRDTLFFSPTVVTGIKMDDPLMQEEIFGPILPVLDATLDEAISLTRGLEHSLALYGFTSSQAEKDRILAETLSGGVCFNDCMMQVVAKDAPFGGVGSAGFGAYHGPYGIRQFSHMRTTVDPPTWLDRVMAARYPPYSLEKSAKMNPDITAPFDRDGNPTGFFGRFSK
ncbi:aldehyde dehydrogenase [Thozetella sp. PMI_491]|nr:aldehyde dehydrogenase [Thozetella sp. PMI_491]